MNDADEWGRDPSVRFMRAVFRRMEEKQIYHDPVSPVLKAPAEIGWEAWFRTIDLVTPRKLKGRELLMRTRGWWTVDPADVLDRVEEHGRLVLGEKGELMVELKDRAAVDALSSSLSTRFGDQVFLAP